MATGTVKWFNNAKGYGFIVPGNGGVDVFAHYSTIEMNGYKTLRAGQLVQFEAVQGPNGMQTSLVKSLEQIADGNTLAALSQRDDSSG
jgi:CspA family cold shock protein